MIVHLVMFRLKAGLTAEHRDQLADALLLGTREIPSIRAARIGARITVGRPYEQLMTTNYSFAALLEFDNVDGLRAYLDHPVHERLANTFYASIEQALTYDYELWEAEEGVENVRAVG